jgi:signal peptidase I
VGLALIVAFLLRTFVVQVFFIPSSSMVPTLAVDDRIVVEKVSYRFREPVRGDVVVFAGADRVAVVDDDRTAIERVIQAAGRFIGVVPPDPSDLVKRVIGLPGDEVSIVDGLLHIDGVALTEPYLTGPVASDFGPVVVPDGSLFFLGDNRRNSADSRGGLGFVDERRVIGRAVAVVWPFGNAASLLGERPLPQTSSVG